MSRHATGPADRRSPDRPAPHVHRGPHGDRQAGWAGPAWGWVDRTLTLRAITALGRTLYDDIRRMEGIVAVATTSKGAGIARTIWREGIKPTLGLE